MSAVLRVDHRVVIGERHVGEELAVVVAVERPPAAVAVLHRQHPPRPRQIAASIGVHRLDVLDSAAADRWSAPATTPRSVRLRRVPLRAPVADRSRPSSRRDVVARQARGERHQHHRRVVDVGIELVVELEEPAARLELRIADRPVARASALPSTAASRPPSADRPDARPARPPRAGRSAAMAVSHTGDLHGCSRSARRLRRSPSLSSSLELPPAPRASRRRSPRHLSATTLQMIGGKIAPRPSLSANRSIIQSAARRIASLRSGLMRSVSASFRRGRSTGRRGPTSTSVAASSRRAAALGGMLTGSSSGDFRNSSSISYSGGRLARRLKRPQQAQRDEDRPRPGRHLVDVERHQRGMSISSGGTAGHCSYEMIPSSAR